MRQRVAPLLEAHPQAMWLTIGDSGADAAWLRAKGARVTASSISLAQLTYLKDHGYLEGIDIEVQNAEQISREDSSVDYVYCKEAYHHLPRPAIGLYEMCRVAKRAVVLCEPYDGGRPRLLDWVVRLVKRSLRKNDARSELFEPIGNYIYRLSIAETLKISTALQLHSIYFAGLSDFYVQSLCRRPVADSLPRTVVSLAIATQEFLCKLGLMNWGRVVAVIFKVEPPAALSERLRRLGYSEKRVPLNPYL